MSQLTFQMDPKSERLLDELMEIFESPSKAAALRAALSLAGAVGRKIKDDTLIVRDQEADEDVRITLL